MQIKKSLHLKKKQKITNKNTNKNIEMITDEKHRKDSNVVVIKMQPQLFLDPTDSFPIVRLDTIIWFSLI